MLSDFTVGSGERKFYVTVIDTLQSLGEEMNAALDKITYNWEEK